MTDEKRPKKKISIEIQKDVEGGVYFNQALIIHTNKEFMIDFCLALPDGKARVQSRVITNPVDLKALLYALKENVDNFEKKYGTITLPGAASVVVPEDKEKIH